MKAFTKYERELLRHTQTHTHRETHTLRKTHTQSQPSRSCPSGEVTPLTPSPPSGVSAGDPDQHNLAWLGSPHLGEKVCRKVASY